MKIIYMGKNKPSCSKGLKYLVERGIEIVAVVAPPIGQLSFYGEPLIDTSNNLHIPTTTDNALYKYLEKKEDPKDFSLKNIDLVISYLFWKRIKRPLIELPKIGCINFHPAPLPEYRGVGGYAFAIYENKTYYGVSAHFVDENFDTGDLIKVIRFDMNPNEETAFSLEQKCMGSLLELFKEVTDIAKNTGSLPREPQPKNQGKYISKKDFEITRKINSADTLEEIERKIRSFWYPPYPGATINIQGKEFTLINEKILKEISNIISNLYHSNNNEINLTDSLEENGRLPSYLSAIINIKGKDFTLINERILNIIGKLYHHSRLNPCP